MECKGIREKLSTYLEGVVSSEEKGLIEEHLNSCRQCSASLADLKRTGELIQDLEEVEPPAWLTKKIISRVRAEGEQKRGVLQKLFFPLHLKVPIEALAMVLIAVIAVHVFRAVEPEMKSMQIPPATGPAITREEAPNPSLESGADSLVLKSKTTLKEHPPIPPAKPSPSRPVKEPLPPEKKEALAQKSEEAMKIGGALKKQDLPEWRKTAQSSAQEREDVASSPAAQDTRDRKKPVAAPMASKAASLKPRLIGFTVNVKDLKIAASEVEKFLGQLAARKIERESTEGKEVLTADLKGQSVEEFSEKLKAVGEIKEKSLPLDIPEGNISIRVEIVSTP